MLLQYEKLVNHVTGGNPPSERAVRAHDCCVLSAAVFLSGNVSASARCAASGESATFRIEFLPPNGLSTVSLASGSGSYGVPPSLA